MFEMKLPDIGEGVAEAELVSWKIEAGQSVIENEPLAEFLTDKASVDIPSPVKGKVLTLAFKEGDIVHVGDVFIQIDDQAHPGAEASPKKSNPTSCAPASSEVQVQAPAKDLAHHPPQVPPRPGHEVHKSHASKATLATPAIRKEAKELGLDLSRVKGSGPDGRITHADLVSQVKPQASGPKPLVFPPEKDAEDWKRQPFKGIRRMIADNMHRSKQLIPHFTYVEEIDFSKLEGMRKNSTYKSPLPFIALACLEGLKKHSILNTSLDPLRDEIIFKKNVHLGIAVAAQEGLVVPVVHHASDQKLDELHQSIAQCSKKAKEGQCKSKDLKGGTFTISSLGKFGGLVATPIIRYPEVAILGVHAIKKVPRFNTNGEVIEASIANLSLSVDHRVADGIVAAEFMQVVKERLEQAIFPELEA